VLRIVERLCGNVSADDGHMLLVRGFALFRLRKFKDAEEALIKPPSSYRTMPMSTTTSACALGLNGKWRKPPGHTFNLFQWTQAIPRL
jgi:hypothetical protein